jgi:hypothetical protein
VFPYGWKGSGQVRLAARTSLKFSARRLRHASLAGQDDRVRNDIVIGHDNPADGSNCGVEVTGGRIADFLHDDQVFLV